MSLLSAADLAYMQDTQEDALPGTVVIERYGLSNDGMGNAYETWTASGTVIGRIYQRASGSTRNEAIGGEQQQSVTSWWATFPNGTDVSAKDRLVYDGKSWEVLSTNNGEMWKTAVRCELTNSNEERRT